MIAVFVDHAGGFFAHEINAESADLAFFDGGFCIGRLSACRVERMGIVADLQFQMTVFAVRSVSQ